jgi:hypothetical protein
MKRTLSALLLFSLLVACDEAVVEPDVSPGDDALSTPLGKVESVANGAGGGVGAGSSEGFIWAIDDPRDGGQLILFGFSCGFDLAFLSRDEMTWSMDKAHVTATTLICQQQVDLSWSRDRGRLYPDPITNEWYDFFTQEDVPPRCSTAATVAHEVYGSVGSNASIEGTIDGSQIAWDFAFIFHDHFHRQLCGPGEE